MRINRELLLAGVNGSMHSNQIDEHKQDRPILVLLLGSVGTQFTPATQDLLNNLNVGGDPQT